ncbi:pilus assembly protein PilO [Nodularia spumigena]|uniref:pilus assembly protein PilO n=1 Tax=Nodularia spumigena TaxID=70799 RepID=UPI00232DFC84|nr:pilus assembly protein PilO [Nodularia spumigena]MDB9347122.1 pilus assembly protein PilO [Nodularia spumigena CS-588/01]MDB9354024.1 pilus assembly protein PilO [Nodularia spumigena CS-588/05]
MTVSQDLNFDEQSGEFGSEASAPVIFGITLTPKIMGIVLGVLGIGGAAYMILNMIMPAWETYQQRRTQANDLQGQVDQKQASVKQIGQVKAELAQAKQETIQVLSLFADENTLDTLLLDINRLVESGNAEVPANAVTAKLQKFEPDSEPPEPITDGSLGPTVDGKLKRSSIKVEIEGTFAQTQSIMRNIERLQPLLIVKNYQARLSPEPTNNSQDEEEVIVRVGPAPITTSFELQPLMPLNPEEIAARKAQEAEAAAPKK